jgi:hypothetical protein
MQKRYIEEFRTLLSSLNTMAQNDPDIHARYEGFITIAHQLLLLWEKEIE